MVVVKLRRTMEVLALAAASFGVAACSVIVGTDDYRECQGEECAVGGGGAGTGASGSSSSSNGNSSSASGGGGSGACAAGKFPVTVIRNGSVEVHTDPEDHDFEDGADVTQCVGGAMLRLEARCPGGGGSDEVEVSWGNPACPTPAKQCIIDPLDGPESFEVTQTGACPQD